MEKRYIFRCEDTVEGIFTGIYDAWVSPHRHEEKRIEICREDWEELALFAEYTEVVPDTEKSRKVQHSVRTRISEEAYEMVMKAVLSQEEEKGEIIYRFLIDAFKKGVKIGKSFGNPWVMQLFEIVRGFENEAHHLKGFLRFEEQENGLLLARYAPKNNVMEELMQHFADRLNTESFMIFDVKRRIAGVHPSGGQWFVYQLNDEEYCALSGHFVAEDTYSVLWKIFHTHIAIRERKNNALQRSNLPLRFRPYMTEFSCEKRG